MRNTLNPRKENEECWTPIFRGAVRAVRGLNQD